MIQIEVLGAVLLALGSFLIIRAVLLSDEEATTKINENSQIPPASNYERAA